MGQAFLMVLREGFESFLIVAVILSYLRQTNQRMLFSAVYLAIGFSILVSVGLGLLLMKGINQSLWEGVLGVVTILLVGSLVVHMWKAAPHLKTQIHRGLWLASRRRSAFWAYAGVFLFTVVMISREGMETALMLLQVRDSGVIGGILLGLVAAAAVSWAWANYSHLINLKRFFQVTSVFLVIFMVQIAVYSFHEFSEAGILPNSEALHVATESFSPMGRYGQWFSMVSVGGCALWLMLAQILDYRKRALAARVVILMGIALGLLSGLGIIGVIGIRGAEAAEKEGPQIQASQEELEKEVKDEEELKRLGNFGRFHIFGYGELHYNGKIGPTGNQIDFHRLVLGVGYDFTDWLKFRSELDFEHAFKEPELEFAYLDFLVRPWFNPRIGAVLVPMGVINQHHEPPLFYSVERPELYRVIIPTSWQGAGAGFYGKLPAGFEYELYGLSSLTAVSLDGAGGIDQSFSGSEGFHDDHSIGEAPGRDFGAAGRLEYKGVSGLRLGTSFFVGNTGQGNGAIGGGLLTMVEGDAKYSFQGIDLEGIFAFTNLSDAGNINNVLIAADPTFTDFVGSQMIAWYVEGAYHLFHHLLPETKHDLVVFGRFEDFNTQHKMPGGFAADPANDRRTVTTGISYLPIPQVAIKADYMFNWNSANAGVDQFNLGVGFYY